MHVRTIVTMLTIAAVAASSPISSTTSSAAETASPSSGGIAAAVSSATVDYGLGDLVGRQTQFSYGVARGASIPIGVDTKRVVIVPPETAANGSLRGDVGCTLYGNHSASIDNPYQKDSLGLGAFKYWTEREWADPSARYIDLEPGAVAVWPNRDADDYDRFDLYCSGSNEDEPFRITRVLWRLTPYEAAAPTVTLTPDPANLFSDSTIDQHIDRAARRTAAAGDRIRVAGPASTWPALDDPNALVKTVVTGVPGNPAGLDPSVDADGATLAFTVPTIPAAAAPYAGGFFVNTLSARSVGATSVQKTIIWTGGVTLTPAARSASTTTLAVWPTRTLSVLPVRAHVRVQATDGAIHPFTGTIVIRVDGRVVAGPVQVLSNGTQRITLPRLQKGTRLVTAEYSGDLQLIASTSSAQPLRVYF